LNDAPATWKKLDKVAQAYRVLCEAVEAAMAYYRQHKQLIDARIEANIATVG
jgi:hypothetical protein